MPQEELKLAYFFVGLLTGGVLGYLVHKIVD